MFVLQSRWKEKGNKFFYYGLRNKGQMFKNEIKVNKKQLDIIHSLPKELNEEESKAISKLIKFGVVVKEESYHQIPKSITEARFCKECAMNDYMVPGAEFDENGLCPICQTKEVLEQLKGVNPVVNTFPRSKKSRFDVAVFYTGGKDSTYIFTLLLKQSS